MNIHIHTVYSYIAILLYCSNNQRENVLEKLFTVTPEMIRPMKPGVKRIFETSGENVSLTDRHEGRTE